MLLKNNFVIFEKKIHVKNMLRQKKLFYFVKRDKSQFFLFIRSQFYYNNIKRTSQLKTTNLFAKLRKRFTNIYFNMFEYSLNNFFQNLNSKSNNTKQRFQQ